MKKTDLYKNLALKINEEMKQSVTPDRFSKGAALDRKEQRKIDQAKGLIPFAAKLNIDLVNEIRALAESRQIGMNEMLDELLRKGLHGA
jgi:hypothetical protein